MKFVKLNKSVATVWNLICNTKKPTFHQYLKYFYFIFNIDWIWLAVTRNDQSEEDPGRHGIFAEDRGAGAGSVLEGVERVEQVAGGDLSRQGAEFTLLMKGGGDARRLDSDFKQEVYKCRL